MTTITIEQAYEKGWIAAAKWASRDDLVADIGSTAYMNDRDAALAAPATAPEQPAWHDAPTVPGLWWVAGTAGIFHIDEAALPIYKGSAHRWFGPIPPDSGDKS